MKKTRIAILASGGGSNARKIMEHFRNSDIAEVALVVSNKKDAGVLKIANEYHVPTLLIERQDFYQTNNFLTELEEREIEFIVLAGFLWLVPAYLVNAFSGKILNIHPALLPKYGGKGMYGHHVHEAVKAAGETESGPTIHWVNEHYDEGNILFQARCRINPEDTADDIARKVLELEHAHYARIIEQEIRKGMHH